MATTIIITRPKKNEAANLTEQTEIKVHGLDDASDAELLRAAADQIDPPPQAA